MTDVCWEAEEWKIQTMLARNSYGILELAKSGNKLMGQIEVRLNFCLFCNFYFRKKSKNFCGLKGKKVKKKKYLAG